MAAANRAQEFTEIRKGLGISQPEAARLLDLAIREYQAFEWGECEIPDLYILAFERIALSHAALHGDPMMASASVREEALTLAKLILCR